MSECTSHVYEVTSEDANYYYLKCSNSGCSWTGSRPK